MSDNTTRTIVKIGLRFHRDKSCRQRQHRPSAYAENFISNSQSAELMDNLRIYFACSLFFIATIAEAETIFKWVDEQGVTHYSAGTPPSKNAQQLRTQPAPAASEGGSQQSSVREWEGNENVKNYRQRREQQEEADNRRKEEQARRCADSRERLDLFQREGRLYKYNEKGEKEYWEDDARAAEIRRMKEEIKTNC